MECADGMRYGLSVGPPAAPCVINFVWDIICSSSPTKTISSFLLKLFQISPDQLLFVEAILYE